MDADEVAELRVLLAQARARPLGPDEQSRYLGACRRLEEALNHAQLLLAPAGARLRRRFRVVRSFPVSIREGGAWSEARTVNLSAGGFCLRTPRQVPLGERVLFRMTATPGAEPVCGEAVCRNGWKKGEQCYSAFEFAELDAVNLARLELEVVEAALEMLWPSGRLGP